MEEIQANRQLANELFSTCEAIYSKKYLDEKETHKATTEVLKTL